MYKILLLLFVTILALCSVRSDEGVLTKAGRIESDNEFITEFENQIKELKIKNKHLQKRLTDFKRYFASQKENRNTTIDLFKEDDVSDPYGYEILLKMDQSLRHLKLIPSSERPNCDEQIELESTLPKHQQELFAKESQAIPDDFQKQFDSLETRLAQLVPYSNKRQGNFIQSLNNSQSKVKDTSNGLNKTFEEIGNSELTNVDNLTMQMKNIEYSVAPKSCVEAIGNSNLSGIFNVQLKTGLSSVYCNKDGWLRIQQQFDGPLSFNRSWLDYRNGFGVPNGQYWMGLENIRQITMQKRHELYIKMTEFDNTETFARYDDFLIGPEAEKYKLKILGTLSGNCRNDNLNYNLNMDFTTFDSDNDLAKYRNCAEIYGSGWWFNDCANANLNQRVSNSTEPYLFWNKYTPLKQVEMYIRMK